jgi:two-component system, response regulator PdtaR
LFGREVVPVPTVLVVEDEPVVLFSICEDLASEGYEVVPAANADKAIEILESRNDINTVFTDVEMPGSMDGLRLAAAVRDRWPPIHIVITSGRGRPLDAQMPARTQFLGKPYQTADVLTAFRAFG